MWIFMNGLDCRHIYIDGKVHNFYEKGECRLLVRCWNFKKLNRKFYYPKLCHVDIIVIVIGLDLRLDRTLDLVIYLTPHNEDQSEKFVNFSAEMTQCLGNDVINQTFCPTEF